MPLCAWFIAASFAAPASAAALDITTEHNPPFNFREQKRITGISTDILMEMGRRAGIPLNIHLLPWGRAYQSALSTPDTCVYSTVRMPEREASFKWVGPLSTNKWALFARNDFNKKIATIDDARPYRIGGVARDAKVLYLKSLGFTDIDLVGDDNLNLAKLLGGRIDLWITGLYKTRDASVKSEAKHIKPVLVVREVEYFLACHPKTSDATLLALSQALKTLQKEGYVQNVTKRYEGWLQ